MSASRPLRVLVVDDDGDCADSMAEVLSLHGFHVHAARNGTDSLCLAAADPPDVVLLDQLMPGMDGCELARRLVKASARRPFLVMISGCGTDEDRRRADGVGIDLYFTKPVALALLVEFLQRYGERPRVMPAADRVLRRKRRLESRPPRTLVPIRWRSVLDGYAERRARRVAGITRTSDAITSARSRIREASEFSARLRSFLSQVRPNPGTALGAAAAS